MVFSSRCPLCSGGGPFLAFPVSFCNPSVTEAVFLLGLVLISGHFSCKRGAMGFAALGAFVYLPPASDPWGSERKLCLQILFHDVMPASPTRETRSHCRFSASSTTSSSAQPVTWNHGKPPLQTLPPPACYAKTMFTNYPHVITAAGTGEDY